MPFEPTFAAGITFIFGGATYTATSISVSRSASEFDVTSTDITPSATSCRRFRLGEIESCDIKVDWVGLVVPAVDQPYAFSLTSGLGHTGTKALCTGLNITASAGELIKGSATFKVSYD